MESKNNVAKENKQFYDPMSVRWLEKYDEKFSKCWNRIPKSVRSFIAALLTFLFGISISGNWISIVTHTAIQFGFINKKEYERNWSWNEFSFGSSTFKDFSYYCFTSNLASFVIYYGTGGFLHWYYYVCRKDRAEEWKCQPKKWLSPELERHEIIFGSITLFINASFSAIVTCYIANGGYSTLYFTVSDFGWLWFFLQYPIIFIYMEHSIYWIHRLYHWPWLYKNFHKLHHKYKQPTAFSVTAIHPVESLHIQITLLLPIFVISVHWFPFYSIVFYNYIHGILDHSGINFKAQWWQPWQPDTIFHDNHHQYFHVNFGFNMEIWDKLYGTYRRKDRIYREDLYYGQGKDVSEVTPEEIAEDLKERNSENPLAYSSNIMPYKLNETDIQELRKNFNK